MKIAILSDIHGNLDALESVIQDIQKQEIKDIFICGDLAMAGPQPIETIDYINELAKQFNMSIIQGNTDEMIVKTTGQKDDPYIPPNEIMADALKYAKKILRQDQIQFLANLPFSKHIEIEKLKILLVHGSPRKNNEDIMPDMPKDKLEEVFNGIEEDIIFCGHTHLPVIYELGKQKVVNVGSVGRPFTETPDASYAVLNYLNPENNKYNIELKKIPYDYNSASTKLAELPFKGSEKLAQMLINATSRYPQ